jgi:hypothetical protein
MLLFGSAGAAGGMALALLPAATPPLALLAVVLVGSAAFAWAGLYYTLIP